MKIKVGDKVTWREKPNALAVTGCIVKELGEAPDGQPAALLDCGRFGDNNAYVKHLFLEEDDERPS